MRILITVLLCLLSMTAAHAQNGCGPGRAGWRTAEDRLADLQMIHVIELRGHGSVVWNHTPVTRLILQKQIAAESRRPSYPIFRLIITEGADCREADRIRKLMERWLDCRKQCDETAWEEEPEPPVPAD